MPEKEKSISLKEKICRAIEAWIDNWRGFIVGSHVVLCRRPTEVVIVDIVTKKTTNMPRLLKTDDPLAGEKFEFSRLAVRLYEAGLMAGYADGYKKSVNNGLSTQDAIAKLYEASRKAVDEWMVGR